MDISKYDKVDENHRKWRKIIEKLLFRKKTCNVCFQDDDLTHWDVMYFFKNDHHETELSLKNIVETTFGFKVSNLLPSEYFCESCITIILEAYTMVNNIKNHNNILQKYLSNISENLSQCSIKEKEPELMLTIDNVQSLQIPTTVTFVQEKTQIIPILTLEVDGENLLANTDNTESNSDAEYEYRNDIFICDTCHVKFATRSGLVKHIGEKHNNFSDKCPHCLNHFKSKLRLKHHRCPFKCTECDEECIHERFLLYYREQHMANHRIFQCIDCDFTYTNRGQLMRHANEHLNHYPHLCDQCGDSFAARTLLTSHRYKKHADITNLFSIKSFRKPRRLPIISSDPNGKIYQCDLCGYCLESEEAYSSHRKKHFYKDTQCQYCSESFNSIGKLNIHIKHQHPNEIISKVTIYQCTMCPKDFELRTEYLKHVATHPKIHPHTCRVCNKSFENKLNYFSHIKKHSTKYDKECQICFKKYTKTTFLSHMRYHLKELEDQSTHMKHSATCDVCRKDFPDEEALLKHSDIHTEVQECPHCNKHVNSVLYRKHLKRHEITSKKGMKSVIKSCPHCDYKTRYPHAFEAHVNRYHLKIRPHQCEICSKGFYSDLSLQGHKMTHKEQRPEYYCELCGNKLISKKALMLHTRIHTGERPYPCDLCDLSFISASRRREHKIRKHFEPSFECETCHIKLYTQSSLRKHEKTVHGGVEKRRRKRKVEVIETEIVSGGDEMDD